MNKKVDAISAEVVSQVLLDGNRTGVLAFDISRLNPSMIKIDQSIIRRSLRSTKDERLLETIVALVHNLETTTLAVGIETTEQFDRLRELHCALGQGFLFSPAVSSEEAAALVAKSFNQ